VGDAGDIYGALKNATTELGHFSVYRKEEILERWHYKNNRRAPPILVLADEGYAFDDVYQNAEARERLKNETCKFQFYIPIHLVRHFIVHIAVFTQQYITCLSAFQCIFLCYKLKCIMGSNIYMLLIALIKKKGRKGIPK